MLEWKSDGWKERKRGEKAGKRLDPMAFPR